MWLRRVASEHSIDAYTKTNSQSCYTFSTNLQLGSRGVDVVALQTFLILKGFSISNLFASNDTQKGYFGFATFQALKKYQKNAGIEATGFFGPITRMKINSECSVPTGNVNSYSNTLKSKDSLVTSTPKASSNIPAQDTLKLFLDNLSKKQEKEMDDYRIEYKKRINANFKQINKIDNFSLTAQVASAELQPVAYIKQNKFTETKKIKFTYSFVPCLISGHDDDCEKTAENTTSSYLKSIQDIIISSLNIDEIITTHWSLGCEGDRYQSWTYDSSQSPKGGDYTLNECDATGVLFPATNFGRKISITPNYSQSVLPQQLIGGIKYYTDVIHQSGSTEETTHSEITVNDDSGVVFRYNGAKSSENSNLGWAYTIRVLADRIFVKNYTNGYPNFYSEPIPCTKIGIGFATTTSSACVFRWIGQVPSLSEIDITPMARDIPFYQYRVEIVGGPYDLFENIGPTISPPPPPSASRDQYLAQISSAFANSIVYGATPSSQVSIFGTGFTSTDNWIRIGNSDIGHIISGVSSADGTSITFTLPDIDVLPIGTYSLDVAGYNTPWSDPVQFNILSTVPPQISSFSVSSLSINSGRPVDFSWKTTPAAVSACTLTGDGPVPKSVPISTNYYETQPITTTTTFTLTCMGTNGQTVSKSITVTVNSISFLQSFLASVNGAIQFLFRK